MGKPAVTSCAAKSATTTSPVIATALDTQIDALYDVRAIFDGLCALGEQLVEYGNGDDSVTRLALVGQRSVDRIIESLDPVREALRAQEDSHG